MILAIDPCFARVRLREFGIENVHEYIVAIIYNKIFTVLIFMWFDTNAASRYDSVYPCLCRSSCKVDMYP